MIDALTRERIAVSTGGIAGPYIMLPLEQLEAVEEVLCGNQLSYWVDADAISLDGKPEIVVINFGRGVSVGQIQPLLDAVQ